jgi:hypothetical protein
MKELELINPSIFTPSQVKEEVDVGYSDTKPGSPVNKYILGSF